MSESAEPTAVPVFDFTVGNRVVVKGRLLGTVEYVGTTHFGSGTWIGVNLDRPCGLNNGEIDGKTYFKCEDKHGLFVHPSVLSIVTDEGEANEQASASIITSAMKGHATRKEVDEKALMKTWMALEDDDEKNALATGAATKNLGSMVNRVHKTATGTPGSPINKSISGTGTSAPAPSIPLDCYVESPYKGIHFEDLKPIDAEAVLSMVESMRAGETLHYKYATRILNEFRTYLAANACTLNEITLPDNAKEIVVVGDTHGQLQDLLLIFEKAGFPSATNPYFINGDFVDRGDRGCEITFIIFAFCLVFPKTFFINRGNHETNDMNTMDYGRNNINFKTECLRKYDRNMYTLFHDCFALLPLASVIDTKVIIVHGGLFRHDNIKLSQIKALPRKRDPVNPPQSFEDQLIEDLLWSDPGHITGRRPNTRGAGIVFGTDVTNKFLRDNSLELLIRSHEPPDEGFEKFHDGRCITVFSASYYTGKYPNFGAIVHVNTTTMAVRITQYKAKPLTAETDAELSENLADETIHKLMERIVARKADLSWYYSQVNENHDGHIAKAEWAKGLQNVLGLEGVPWLKLQPRLAFLETDGRINYTKFLERYQITLNTKGSQTWQHNVIDNILKKIYRSAKTLEEAFKFFDRNGDGLVVYEEFMEALESLDLGLTHDQIQQLMRSIDVNQDNCIEFSEFLERFQVGFTKIHWENVDKLGDEGSWLLTALQQMAETIQYNKLDIQGAFNLFDRNLDGWISYDEFVETLLGVLPNMTEDKLRKMAGYIDDNNSGKINYLEFVNAFKIADRKQLNASGGADVTWDKMVIQQISNTLYQNRVPLLRACQTFDLEDTGFVGVDKFKTCLEKLNELLSDPIHDTQIEELIKAHVDKNDKIQYKDFFRSFEIVDCC